MDDRNIEYIRNLECEVESLRQQLQQVTNAGIKEVDMLRQQLEAKEALLGVAEATIEEMSGLRQQLADMQEKCNVFQEKVFAMREELVKCEEECLEEARLNGMGAEREAALMAALEECERDRDEHLRSWNRVVEERIAVTKELEKANLYADHLGMSLRGVKRERDELVAALEGLSYWSQPRKTDKPELCGFEGKQGDKSFDFAAKALAKLGADKTGEGS